MSIGIEPELSHGADATTASPGGEAFVAELARMANALFHGGGPTQAPPLPGGGLPLNGAAPVLPPPAAPALSPTVPPNPGPSALAPGLRGVSTSQSGPPTPGFLSSPPIASAPPPKDADLRSIGALLADPLHVQPVQLAEAPSPSGADSAPYFLALAGLPSANTLPPQGSVPSQGSFAPSAPGTAQLPSATPVEPSAPLAGSSSTASAPLGAPLPSSALPGSGDFITPQLFASSVEPVPEPRRTSGIFDPNAVKRDFPVLRERVNGRPLVWLDNAATTQKPTAVIERLKYFYEHENSNIHRAAHTLAARATEAYESARQKVQRFVNAPSAKDVIFVRGATEGINLVAQTWGRRNVYAGDEIVISWLEHHANIVPWQQLAAEKGARLRVAPVDSRGQIILEEYEKLLNPRTKIVSITQVSNALGTITPAQEMARMAHRHGACVLIDGAQAVSHIRADVQALDCEFYVFSGHKVFAPTGIGVVYGKSAVLEAMPPWQGGGNMIQD
ncbi:MAG TPA: aminotransferase class V-fold PLP-dependent enzyme, partial [Polyangiaceae bacterium]|nr:aminotransferase class V-fold PLP-dependent enzyme [Polyangiaceae bacterium]